MRSCAAGSARAGRRELDCDSAARLGKLQLANWHMLLAPSPSGVALDVGCGFGTLPLGLASHFHTAVGAEMLPDRLRYATLRASGTVAERTLRTLARRPPSAALGADPGPARFASPLHRPGALTIFTHDGQRILSAVELGPVPEGGSSGALCAAARWPRATELPARLSGTGEFNGIDYRIFLAE